MYYEDEGFEFFKNLMNITFIIFWVWFLLNDHNNNKKILQKINKIEKKLSERTT